LTRIDVKDKKSERTNAAGAKEKERSTALGLNVPH
jgi:hypothetical protein